MPLQATSGAASYDAFGGGVPIIPNYIEEVFSTWLYTGNGGTQTITNGIDLSTNGGLVWIKTRNIGANHQLFDTNRGVYKRLASNTTSSEFNFSPNGLTAFNSNGFTLSGSGDYNLNGYTQVGWTFRKQPKFFDVVTYTGTGSARTIAHNLGSAPGFMIVKVTSTADQWCIYHRSQGATKYGLFNTDAFDTYSGTWNNTEPTATVFTVGNDAFVNASGETYVAYLFAHNAGGFGLTGTDNVISCGSYAGTGSANNNINLGYEAQWVLIKNTTSAGNGWILVDNMCGGLSETTYAYLQPNTSGAEVAGSGASLVCATATGFRVDATGGAFNASGDTYIYIAIRRGPMKVPTSGTSVFSPNVQVGSESTGTVKTTNFAIDAQITGYRVGFSISPFVHDRLRGVSTSSTEGGPMLITSSTSSEAPGSSWNGTRNWNNTSFSIASNWAGNEMIYWNFKRAPSFFDEVCYTGTGVNARAITHNLGVAPEMIIVKKRTGADGWVVWASGLTSRLYELYLNDPRAQFVEASPRLNVNNAPTSTQFEVGTDGEVNASGATYVSYLFATCAGVSKVGSYTGTGTTKQVDCGFTGGARFVLIKRTDSTGDWYVWDSARGIVAGNDPYLLLNSTAAEVTSTDYVDTYSAGFEVSSTAPAAINASGGTFIFLAIA